MNKNILLTTVFSGFNYGSSLQALAGKMIIESFGCSCNIVKLKSYVKGRDVRLKKLISILYRSLLLSNKSALRSYRASYKKSFITGSEDLFNEFTNSILRPNEYSWKALKRLAENSLACFSGSDQIWNSSTLYVDPLYYLRFAPKYKRVAFAPSFGRDFIADYNRKKMSLWIGEYPYLSIREDSGVKLIKDLTGRKAEQLLDPTLIINASQWKETLNINKIENKDFILAYFLDVPSSFAKAKLKELKSILNCEIVSIPYEFEDMSFCDRTVAAGPKEFVNLVANAKIVCTDSFHGTAFSINMHTPFFTFEREYGSANKQSERVLSILRKVNMIDRFQPKTVENWDTIDFEYSENVLDKEREKAYQYINNAITEIKKHEK